MPSLQAQKSTRAAELPLESIKKKRLQVTAAPLPLQIQIPIIPCYMIAAQALLLHPGKHAHHRLLFVLTGVRIDIHANARCLRIPSRPANSIIFSSGEYLKNSNSGNTDKLC
jgi:hypothetical protein